MSLAHLRAEEIRALLASPQVGEVLKEKLEAEARRRGLDPKRRPGQPSKLEVEYVRLLNAGMAAGFPAWFPDLGDVAEIHHQPGPLQLARNTRYYPDVQVVYVHGHIAYHEVKGFMRDDSSVKLKVAAGQYPEHSFWLARKKKGLWQVKRVRI